MKNQVMKNPPNTRTTVECPHCGGAGRLPTYPPDPRWVRVLSSALLAEIFAALAFGALCDLVPSLKSARVPGGYWIAVALVLSFSFGLPVVAWSSESTARRPSLRGRTVAGCVLSAGVLALALWARLKH